MLNIDLRRAYADIHEMHIEPLRQIYDGDFGDFGRQNRATIQEEARRAWDDVTNA